MTFEPINALTSYVSSSNILPDDLKDLRRVLNDLLTQIIEALNDKEIAQYNTVELLNGQQFFTPGDPNNFRQVYRTVIDFGALPNTATTSIPHGISVDANTIFTRIYGVATDPNTAYIPLPFVNTGVPGDSVQLDVDPININITTTTANYIGYSTVYIVVEYLKY